MSVRPQIITLILSIKSKYTKLDWRGEHYRGKETGSARSDGTNGVTTAQGSVTGGTGWGWGGAWA